jgi:methyl-accepting chemotaxis protein
MSGTALPPPAPQAAPPPSDSGSWLQKVAKEAMAPTLIVAIMLGILGWFLADKFSSINEEMNKNYSALDKRIDDKISGVSDTMSARFSSLDKRIDEKFDPLKGDLQNIKETAGNLDASVARAVDANGALKDLLNSKSQKLVDQINQTALVSSSIDASVRLLNQKMDELTNNINEMKASLGSLAPLPDLVKDIDGRTMRLEGVIMEAPWNRKQE